MHYVEYGLLWLHDDSVVKSCPPGFANKSLRCSLFAEDCVKFFNSRADLEKGASYLFNHLRKFGLQVHVGKGDNPSKTEAMYFPPPRVEYSAADTSRITVLDSIGTPVGFVDFTKEFRYLGSIIHHSLTSDADVDKRIKSATAAFGALKNIYTDKHIDLKVKGRIYVALCLSILLYGCEIWCLREDLFAASITAVAAPFVALLWPTPFVTVFHLKIS